MLQLLLDDISVYQYWNTSIAVTLVNCNVRHSCGSLVFKGHFKIHKKNG